MKKLLTFVLIGIFLLGNFCTQSFAAKKMSGGITDSQITSMNNTVDRLTQKMYSHCYFSPSDAANLIGIKIKLDDAMLMSPDPKYAVLYFKLGRIYQKRGKKDEAVDCYQTIMENFSDTALAPKAGMALKLMGVKVTIPKGSGGSSDDE